ncbi:PLP-dependent aminotransferase family protein [Streptomyces nitrosporeus]|uniref:PLP-dependent aminotransferase family protein n=1 Tax=Streptomyces nitrosporeus TaxID=28894 RepID=A0A5J6FHJ3_9ACTN|nr:PLP-dependent aminotransferase family protein [Streptomyces nitrosporeus]QEU75683.1 PLP-dependent aminotransferase family protein [Streptomyces nitrosporeus]GGY87201.1 GntR family transcriptional regulator [Streptomyces nitrosporeus]
MRLSGTNPPADDGVPEGRVPSRPAWELLLPAASSPVRGRGRALRSALREAVRSGRLPAGTRLPASRELATDLGVSRGLVTEAYEQLTAEGYLRSGRGAGTWVSDAVRPPVREAARNPAPRAPVALVDFRPGTPDLSLFPRAAWAAAQRAALARLSHGSLGYPDPRGLPELREALAALLARRRGVVADPERLVVCSGVAQAATLFGSVLRGRGVDAVGVEDPGSPEHTSLFASAGLRTVALPLDGEGLVPEPLTRSGVRALVTTPAHQFPTGIAYSAGRRGRLLAWARSTSGVILEDDYDGDFRYDRAPVGALQGLDPEHVVYAGSVSKSLAPGLRLGWLVAPASMTEEIVARKRTMDLGNPAIDQAVLADLVRRGAYDRQLRRCQRVYRERRDVLTAALAEHLPGTEVSGIAAGLHIIARLPEGLGPQEEVLRRAEAGGVAVRPLSCYGATASAAPGGTAGTAGETGEAGAPGTAGAVADGGVTLVFGYAHLPPADILRGVRLLASAVRP